MAIDRTPSAASGTSSWSGSVPSDPAPPTGPRPARAPASSASNGSSSVTPTAPRATTAGSSGSPTTGPTTSGSRSVPTRPGRPSRPRPASGSSPITGGLDLWPADPAIPKADYTESLTAEQRAVRAPRRRRGRCAAGRSGGSTTTRPRCARRRAAWPTRSRAMRRIGAWPTARGATLSTGRRSRRSARSAARSRCVAGGTTHRAGRVVVAADAWTNELLAPFDRRLPLTVTKEQVTYVAAPDPAAFAPDRFPVWIWMDDPSFYGFPTYGEAGPKIAQDCGGQPTTPTRARSSATRPPYARTPRVPRPSHLPSARRARHLHEDLPLHPDPGPGLRRRPAARRARASPSSSGPPTGSSSPRCSGASRPSSSLDGADALRRRDRGFRIDRPILLEAEPSTSWMV